MRGRRKIGGGGEKVAILLHLISSFHSKASEKLRSFFNFDGYEWFDIRDANNEEKLVDILIGLMKCQKDELRSSAASLLFNIYNVRREGGGGRRMKRREERITLQNLKSKE